MVATRGRGEGEDQSDGDARSRPAGPRPAAPASRRRALRAERDTQAELGRALARARSSSPRTSRRRPGAGRARRRPTPAPSGSAGRRWKSLTGRFHGREPRGHLRAGRAHVRRTGRRATRGPALVRIRDLHAASRCRDAAAAACTAPDRARDAGEAWRTSPTTPTIVIHLAESKPHMMRWPMGSSAPKLCRASDSLMTATKGGRRGRRRRTRGPADRERPCVRKYPGPARRNRLREHRRKSPPKVCWPSTA
jgi:hypothetical protein